jgi:hypothetical protein
VTQDEHRERHKLLHQMMDELVADYLMHVRGAMPSTSTLMQLMEWSHAQTIDPTELRQHDTDSNDLANQLRNAAYVRKLYENL